MIEKPINSKAIAIAAGPRTSFLDHLIPLCHLWDIPLLCTDPWVFTCAQNFYPSTEIFLAEQDDFQNILSGYENFVTVEPCRLHSKGYQFGQFLYRGEAKTVAGFHGNPSKYRDQFWIERYAHEDVLLVYGHYLVDYLKEKKVWERLQRRVFVGNLREKFYRKHKSFFDRVALPHLFPPSGRKTIFWAPTWSYPANFAEYEKILENIPPVFQLLVKFHPFMYRLYPEKMNELKAKWGQRESLLFLDEIPLIYPLLEKVDFYLGDDSSIAFDFLFFNRPIFCLGPKLSWATPIHSAEDLQWVFDAKDNLFEEREQMYRYVFEASCGE